jgi:hypothetical protein
MAFRRRARRRPLADPTAGCAGIVVAAPGHAAPPPPLVAIAPVAGGAFAMVVAVRVAIASPAAGVALAREVEQQLAPEIALQTP